MNFELRDCLFCYFEFTKNPVKCSIDEILHCVQDDSEGSFVIQSMKCKKMQIKNIEIKIILDSRGEKTLECEMFLNDFNVKSSVPSGKSKGAHEMVSVECEKALENFLKIKNDLLVKDFGNQAEFDNYLISLDGTSNKSNLGGNLILVLSLTFAKLKAREGGKELWEYIGSIFNFQFSIFKIQKERSIFAKIFSFGKYATPPNLPLSRGGIRPIFNVINGGAHAKNNLDFQEFQVIPEVSDFGMALSIGREFYRKLGEILENKFGKENITLGDEAGYSAPFKNNEEALEIIAELIRVKKYPLRIGLDVAAAQFYQETVNSKQETGNNLGSYKISGKDYTPNELLEYYLKLIHTYNIISIEDPFYEEGFGDFARLLKNIQNSRDSRLRGNDKKSGNDGSNSKLVIADDLTTTNSKRLEKAIKEKSGNAILIKLNQIGTLTETLNVIKLAYENNWQTIVSHRSGETMDDFIADLAVAVGAWGLKAGAPGKPERLVKYDRVLRIVNGK